MPKLSIVLPVYNDEKCVRKNIEEILLPYLNSLNIDYEVVVSNDGSVDTTLDIISKIKGITVVSYAQNGGKGKAIRYGFEKATGEYVMFMDVDMAVDLKIIETFLKYADANTVLIGSRRLKDSILVNKPKFIRKIMSKVCNALVNLIFHFRVRDTQCGFKLYPHDLAQIIAFESFVNGYALDVEHLYISKLKKYGIKEIPVTYTFDKKSHVRIFSSTFNFIKDILAIKKHMY